MASLISEKESLHRQRRDRMTTESSSSGVPQTHQQGNEEVLDVVDGFEVPDLEENDEAPPAYGEHYDQLQFSQPGFEAGAALAADGRINVNINTQNSRLRDLLGPTFLRQMNAPELQQPLPPAYIPPNLGGLPGQTPPPQLNIVIQIVGSRGDVQPFVALGKVLKETYGHRVRIATHPSFMKFVEENGLEFFSIGGDPAELMAFMVKHPGLMPGFDAVKSGEVSKRRKGIEEILIGCWRSCIESGDGMGPPPRPHRKDEALDLSQVSHNGKEPFVADAIIANPPSFAHIHIAEKLGIPLHMMFTMPWSPTRAFPHPLANVQNSTTDEVTTSYMTYTLVEMMTWQGLGDIINRFREKALDLPSLSLIWAPGLLNRLRIPYTYCWSPALIPKPADWGNNIDVSGFFFLDLASSFTPEQELADFLAAGPPPVYIGFGSIVVDDPNAMTRMIFDAVRQSGVRALVSKGWGGLGADQLGIPEGVFMLGNCPHDWLFQHVSAVVHHGGAGTTAAGIKAGKPTLVVPFFGDQPFWGAMIARANAGPDPIPYKELTAQKLAEAIKFCLEPGAVGKAKELGDKIREEKGADTGGQMFHAHLDTDSLRCSLAPSRAAAWRVRRTQVPLSPFAASLLVGKEILRWSDLKLYRPLEHSTEDQPPDPITAGASSLIMDLSAFGMGIADMPRGLFKSTKNRETKQKHAKDGSIALDDDGDDDHENKNKPRSAGAETSNVDVASTKSTDLSQKDGSLSERALSEAKTGKPTAVETTAQTSQTEQLSSSKDMHASTGFNIENVMGTGRSVSQLVGTGIRSPMNFCLGLAKGYRNLPRLYNDDTVRPVEKVTGLQSGIKIAGKELGLGVYDGITGLVTQPMRGAEKQGAAGFFKGVGKGIGGLVAKSGAGFWGVPAYLMQGVHVEVSKQFAKSVENYIITSRIIQGQKQLENSSSEEQGDIVARWYALGERLHSFEKFKGKGKQPANARATKSHNVPKDSETSASNLESSPRMLSDSSKDAEFEEAIHASVRETSQGNAEEDARIEAAIRRNVSAVRQRGALPMPVAAREKEGALKDEDLNITDEEYQQLIEQALRESLASSSEPKNRSEDYSQGRPQPSPPGHDQDEQADLELERAIAASKEHSLLPGSNNTSNEEAEELERAIAASREDHERSNYAQNEEDEMMEAVKKQSLAEEEERKQMQKLKGVDMADDTENEDLKRALEESLRMSRGDNSDSSTLRSGSGPAA